MKQGSIQTNDLQAHAAALRDIAELDAPLPRSADADDQPLSAARQRHCSFAYHCATIHRPDRVDGCGTLHRQYHAIRENGQTRDMSDTWSLAGNTLRHVTRKSYPSLSGKGSTGNQRTNACGYHYSNRKTREDTEFCFGSGHDAVIPARTMPALTAWLP